LGDHQFSWVGIQHGADSTSGSLNLYDLSTGGSESFDLPGRVGFAFPCEAEHTYVVGCERTLGLFRTVDRSWAPFCDGIDADVDNTIINDGIVFEDNLIFGTKDLEFATKKAGLYLYRGSDKQLIRLRDDQVCSNGKAILTDEDGGLRLLDIDSPTRTLVSYPIHIAEGKLGRAEVVLDFTGDPAVPDGAILTPDHTGIVIAMFLPEVAEYGETRLYDLPTGELNCTWQTPGSPQNTCPAFVRQEHSLKLIITTAAEHMSAADRQQCPNAGRLFLAEVDLPDEGQPLTSRFPGGC
jgi:sugar lactone lactonase YvrE